MYSDNELISVLLCTYVCKYFQYCSDVGPTDDDNDDVDSDPGTLYKFCMHTYTYVILKNFKVPYNELLHF